jgi:hypothetical protein
MALMILQQSEATAAYRRIPIQCVDATDRVTPETGLTFAASDIKITKNGAAEANSGGTVTEVAAGIYYYEATAAELNTPGFFNVRVAHTACASSASICQVVAFDPYSATNLGLSNLDVATGDIPTANEAADALLDRASAVETNLSVRGAMRLMLSVLAGRVTGAGTGTEVFRAAVSDAEARVTVTVDANGNRTAITYDYT